MHTQRQHSMDACMHLSSSEEFKTSHSEGASTVLGLRHYQQLRAGISGPQNCIDHNVSQDAARRARLRQRRRQHDRSNSAREFSERYWRDPAQRQQLKDARACSKSEKSTETEEFRVGGGTRFSCSYSTRAHTHNRSVESDEDNKQVNQSNSRNG